MSPSDQWLSWSEHVQKREGGASGRKRKSSHVHGRSGEGWRMLGQKMIRCGEQLTEEGDREAGCGGGWRRGFHDRAAHFQNTMKVKMLKKVLTVETSLAAST